MIKKLTLCKFICPVAMARDKILPEYITLFCFLDILTYILATLKYIIVPLTGWLAGEKDGVLLLFYIETCDLPEWEVRTPPLDLRMTFMHVSLCKAFKSHKNLAGSNFSKRYRRSWSFNKLCRQNHIIHYIRTSRYY